MLKCLDSLGSSQRPCCFTCLNIFPFSTVSFLEVIRITLFYFVVRKYVKIANLQCIMQASSYFMLICGPMLEITQEYNRTRRKQWVFYHICISTAIASTANVVKVFLIAILKRTAFLSHNINADWKYCVGCDKETELNCFVKVWAYHNYMSRLDFEIKLKYQTIKKLLNVLNHKYVSYGSR